MGKLLYISILFLSKNHLSIKEKNYRYFENVFEHYLQSNVDFFSNLSGYFKIMNKCFFLYIKFK